MTGQPTARQRRGSPRTGPEQAVSDLIGLARAAGGPDNIACAVADIMAL